MRSENIFFNLSFRVALWYNLAKKNVCSYWVWKRRKLMLNNIQEKINKQTQEKEKIMVEETKIQFNFFISLFPTKLIPSNLFDIEKRYLKCEELFRYLEKNAFVFFTFSEDEKSEIRNWCEVFACSLNQLSFHERNLLIDFFFRKKTEEFLAQNQYISRSTVNRKKIQAMQKFMIYFESQFNFLGV